MTGGVSASRWARAALGAALCFVAACSGGDAPRPNVLVITVDTLRADRLGCYGYERDTSPELDAFAAEALRFAHAYSMAPFTAPSHASLFTSLHTNEHGVRSWGLKIPAAARTLSERFAERGFRTGAFYNHPSLELNDIERGFEHVEKRYFEPAEDTLDGFLAWADQGDEPFCAWVHLWDVHRPYAYRDWSNEVIRRFVQRPPFAFEETRFGSYPRVELGRSEGDYNLTPTRRARHGADEAGWRFIEDRYDGGVYYADRALGRLFDELRARGLYEDTVIVITSDHGETLRERDPVWFTHDPYLYEETLRVPLLVRLPDGERGGEVVETLARGIDVLPTVLEACDLPARGVSGRSLLGDPGEQPVLLYAQTHARHAKEEGPAPPDADGWLEHREIVSDGRRKLLVDVNRGQEFLFDLERDPGETRDLSADPAYAADLERLRLALRAFRLLPPAGTNLESLSAEDQAMLEAIGYAASDD